MFYITQRLSIQEVINILTRVSMYEIITILTQVSALIQ